MQSKKREEKKNQSIFSVTNNVQKDVEHCANILFVHQNSLDRNNIGAFHFSKVNMSQMHQIFKKCLCELCCGLKDGVYTLIWWRDMDKVARSQDSISPSSYTVIIN